MTNNNYHFEYIFKTKILLFEFRTTNLLALEIFPPKAEFLLRWIFDSDPGRTIRQDILSCCRFKFYFPGRAFLHNAGQEIRQHWMAAKMSQNLCHFDRREKSCSLFNLKRGNKIILFCVPSWTWDASRIKSYALVGCHYRNCQPDTAKLCEL